MLSRAKTMNLKWAATTKTTTQYSTSSRPNEN